MPVKRIRHHVNPLGVQIEHTFDGFGNDRPVIVDIGADHGEFIAGLLLHFGETRNFIVFEIRAPLAAKLKKQFEKNQNVIVFDGDATRNFRAIIEPCIMQGAVIEEIYINFPDPWLKDRHKKRRVITVPFLNQCKTFISQETTWIFQTDQKSLFDETQEVLSASGTNHRAQFLDPPYGVTTKWENAKVEAGSTIYRMRFWLRNDLS